MGLPDHAELEALRDVVAAAEKAFALGHPPMLSGSCDHGAHPFPCRCVLHEDLRKALAVVRELKPWE